MEGDISMRTKLIDRVLPNYTRGEELFNMISHIVGGAMGIVVLVLCVVVAARNHNPAGVVGSVIYGITMILLYTMSSIYHGLTNELAKKVFQVLDHCTIYLLIAGTYTPITLSALRRVNAPLAWTVFGVVWGLAVLAITLTAIDIKKYQKFSMTCYIAMGWCVIFAYRYVIQALSFTGFMLLLAGGILYTIGSIIYALSKRKELKFAHSVFHIFVLVGSFIQFICIILYAL